MNALIGVFILLGLAVSLGVGSVFVWRNLPHRFWRWVPGALTASYVAVSSLVPAPATRALIHGDSYSAGDALRSGLSVAAYIVILYWLIWLVSHRERI